MKERDKERYRRLGLELRRLRKANGFSLEQVAEKMSVTKNTILRYETGEIRIRLDLLNDLANILGVSAYHLLMIFYSDLTEAQLNLMEEISTCTEDDIITLTKVVKALKSDTIISL